MSECTPIAAANGSHTNAPMWIYLDGHHLSIRHVPECLRVLAARRLRWHGETGVGSAVESLVSPEVRFANAGLIDLVAYILRRDGIDYQLVSTELGIPHLEPPSIELLPSIGPCDPEYLQLLHTRSRALIRYGADCRVASFIHELALSFPHTTLAVAVSRSSDRDALSAELRKWNLDVTIAHASTAPALPGRIVIGTTCCFAHPIIECWKRTFLIVPNALDVISDRAQDVLLQADARFRLVGLLPIVKRLSPRERDRLAGTFGLDELVIPAHGYLGRRVCVHWRLFRNVRPPSSPERFSDRKKREIWLYRDRNRVIAGIALSAAGQIRSGSATPANAVDRGDPTRNLAVTVLTEGLEHALELAAMIPQWPVLTGSDIEHHGLGNRQQPILQKIKNRATADHQPNAISTFAGLTANRLLTTDILIWAGAGFGAPPLPDAGLRTTAFASHPLLIIDIADGPARWLRRMTEARRNAYADLAWFPPDVDRQDALIERFLDSRWRPHRERASF
jgi:hypothetical protein